MTISLEKIFFSYILGNKRFFHIVKTHFFKNNELKFVYEIIREYVLNNKEAEIPSPKQIWEMVALVDHEGLITKEILKSMLTLKIEDYDEKNFILPKINSWILSNRIKDGTTDIIEQTRNLESLSNIEETTDIANKIRVIVEDSMNANFIKEDDLGSDFDDAEAHSQDSSVLKINSGFNTINTMLGGGWDRGTLNCLMSETNNGKSLWMQNFAVRAANLGNNVLYITLEMSEKKVLKRLGAMRLNIPINDYDEISKDKEFMMKKINALKNSSDDLFEKKIGKIITKFWAAGTATVNDFDFFIQKLKDKANIKIDFIIIDYITLIAPVKGISGDNLYSKGKSIAEGLRAIAAKYDCPVLTAVQVAKDAWNASDITLESVPESKAIAETADTFFAIIRTDEMKKINLYRFKLLKQRDGDFSKSQMRINLNSKYLTLENETFLDS